MNGPFPDLSRHSEARSRRACAAVALRRLAVGVVLSLCLAMPALAQTLPATGLPGAREAGSGAFRYFGLLIYEAKLWISGAQFDPAAPFALGLRYARNIKGARLADESINQWQKMAYGAEDRHPEWGAHMRRIFPDVKPGDELVGVNLAGKGVRFYFNGVPSGEIEDAAFARAFFAIWLDARTTEPALRSALIGEK
jgi:hypothetical protein